MLKTVGIVPLIILILLLAIPLGIGMVMGPCPECSSVETAPMAICLAILSGLLVLAIFGMTALLNLEHGHRVLLLARTVERPPRFA